MADRLKDEDLAFAGWLQQGIDAGWVSEPFCEAHDGAPFTARERELLEQDDGDLDIMDQCMHAVRLMYGVE